MCHRRLVWPFLLLTLSLPTFGAESSRHLGDFALLDVEGRRHTRESWKGSKAVVLFYLATECPVANGYAPEMARLAKEYATKGIAFRGVYPDPDVDEVAGRKHGKDYGLAFPLLLDPRQVLTRSAGVEVTPEAIVASADGRVLYRGRIDDRYSTDGKRRDAPTKHDLREALDAVLAGKAPPVAQTKAFGCPLPPPMK